MNKKIITFAASAALLALPIAALAFNAGATPTQSIFSAADLIDSVLNFVWPLFAGFAVIMFLVAGFLFLSANGDPAKIATARQSILWGVIGVIVGLIAFSLPFVIRGTIGL